MAATESAFTPACPLAVAAADEATLPAAHVTRRVLRLLEGQAFDGMDSIAEEVPVALVYNGISHAVMLATPAELEDFALGFSLAEGIVASPGEIFDIEVVAAGEGIEVRIEIAAERFLRLRERRRSLAGRTGCGLCGVDSLSQAIRHPAPVSTVATVDPAVVARALAELPALQLLHRQTGATHAAAWADHDGRIMLLREDVGRHNALDKLIGALVGAAIAADSGFVVVTSRASVEMVQKVASFGAAMLVAISAPTALAVRLAQETRIALLGFARGGRLTCYNEPAN